MEVSNPYKVFHSTCELLREKTHVVLVRPEYGGNVGSAARAMANMGIRGSLRIVGERTVLDAAAWRMAKHAKNRLENALFFPDLRAALDIGPQALKLASTARIGSPHRPHPVRVGTAIDRALTKWRHEEITDLVLVFGPEADGLSNADVDLCDVIVTIPSSDEYRSLNLSQAVLIFTYELNRRLVEDWPEFQSQGPSQRDRLVSHFVRLAEEVGFILPDDPYKMRPRLEQILSQLPHHVEDVKTLHGLLDQAIRSARAGEPEYKGRYRRKVDERREEK